MGGRREMPFLREAHFGLADMCPTSAIAAHFVAGIIGTWHDADFPREPLVALAPRVGEVLTKPAVQALEDPASNGFHGRPVLVEILATIGASEAVPLREGARGEP